MYSPFVDVDPLSVVRDSRQRSTITDNVYSAARPRPSQSPDRPSAPPRPAPPSPCPGAMATSGCSIFIASRITMTVPFSTRSPTATSTWRTMPGIGARQPPTVSSAGATRSAAPRPARRCRAARARRCARRARATVKRRRTRVDLEVDRILAALDHAAHRWSSPASLDRRSVRPAPRRSAPRSSRRRCGSSRPAAASGCCASPTECSRAAGRRGGAGAAWPSIAATMACSAIGRGIALRARAASPAGGAR